jgi:phospholipid/cholesterol/gamma-HCH transport system substrate-binding protein
MAILRSGRREQTRRDLALQGIVFVIVVVLACGFLALKLQGSFGDTVPVTADLQTAGGSLRTGVDVKMRGMVVGKVAAVEGGANQVRLSLRIDEDEVGQIPANVQARVLPASVFGTSYVDLVAPERKGVGASLRAGDVVKQDLSQKTVELQTALDSIDTLVDALGPSELATALHTVASALDGRGEDLGNAIETFNTYLNRVMPMVPEVRRDLRLLAVNLNSLDRNAPDLLEAADDTRVTLNNLVDRRDQIGKMLGGASELLGDTDAFLRDHEATYLRALGLSQTLVDALYDERVNFRDGLVSTGQLAMKLLTVLEDGYGRVEGIIYASGPDDYTSADCPRYGSLKGGNCD